MATTIETSSAVSVERASEALRRVLTGGASPLAMRDAADVLRRVFREIDGARERPELESHDCPCCGLIGFAPPFASIHLRACPRHPAMVRLRALRATLQVAPEVAAALGLASAAPARELLADVEALLGAFPAKPERVGRWVPQESELRYSLEGLLDGKREEEDYTVRNAVERLTMAMEAWRRTLHRETDPCPFCGAVVPLSDAVGHLLRCDRHPAVALLPVVEATLAETLGRRGAEAVAALFAERDRYVNALRALLMDCWAFDNDLGWNGECAYARGYVEDAFKVARSAAAEVVRVERAPWGGGRTEEEPEGEPLFARPVWEALANIRADGPAPGSHGGTAEDVALLRATMDELLRLDDQLGGDIACPACGRGSFGLAAVEHVLACPLHPARARRRAASARMAVAVAVLGERSPERPLRPYEEEAPPPLRLAWPATSPGVDAKGVPYRRIFLQDGPKAAEVLLTPAQRTRYPDLVASYAKDVAKAIQTWKVYRRATTQRCGACGTALELHPLVEHEVTCGRHPEAARAAALEEALRTMGVGEMPAIERLRRETDAARVEAARLLEYCEAFASSFGDDDRGRALIRSSLVPGWERAREEAKRALARLGVEDPGSAA